MMNDYISRRTAIDGIEEYYKDKKYIKRYLKVLTAICLDLKSVIDTLPSADVQPVQGGHWETIEGWDGDELYRCSECGAEFVLIDGTPKDNDYWFCPHCGADMRGEQNG